MNLLLVDDEEYVIESIKKNMDWAEYGIDQVYMAFSMKQAQNIMEIVAVDVIVCDIVMPRQSGFDFVGWVREKEYDVQVIFLTSYAEFHYARKAIALDSVDYLLKPIDFKRFSEALTEAVKKAEKSRKYEDYRKESLYWKKNQSAVCRDFWQGVLGGRIESEQFFAEAAKCNLFYYEDSFYLLYIVFFEGKKDKGIWDDRLLDFAVGNVLTELMEGNGLLVEAVLSIEKESSVVICREIEVAADKKKRNRGEWLLTNL